MKLLSSIIRFLAGPVVFNGIIPRERTDSQQPPTYELLPCPECKHYHVDGGEWATRLHHTHRCANCGYEWDVGHDSFGIASDSLAVPPGDWHFADGH